MDVLRRLSTGLKKFEHLSSWLQVVIGLACLFVAIAGYLALRGTSESPYQTPTSGSRPGISTVTPSEAAPTTAVDRATSPCVQINGESLICTSADAWFKVATVPCEPKSVQEFLGNEPNYRPLLIETTLSATGCLVRPDTTARQGGATAAQFLNRLSGSLPALTECAHRGGREVVACSQPHSVEMVGAWLRPPSGALSIEACQASAGTYSERNLSIDPDLTTVVLSAENSEFRCAISLRDTQRELVFSVWKVRNGQLNFAP